MLLGILFGVLGQTKRETPVALRGLIEERLKFVAGDPTTFNQKAHRDSIFPLLLSPTVRKPTACEAIVFAPSVVHTLLWAVDHGGRRLLDCRISMLVGTIVECGIHFFF